jgi:outer membrane receptor protein involved in Fe transport
VAGQGIGRTLLDGTAQQLRSASVQEKLRICHFFHCNQHCAFVISPAMFTKRSDTWPSSTDSRSLQNHQWLLAFAMLILLLAARQPGKAQTTEAERVTVFGEPVPTPTPHDNWREMRQHIMPEVSGTEITVTKKATVIKLDQQPPVENNDLQDLFLKAPGFQITDQHTPGQFNFNYRGLGNPQESEFTLVLRDGLPLMSDWIGFPTLYYLPLPQSISEIQFIRGGSSLLYGPEPAPAEL